MGVLGGALVPGGDLSRIYQWYKQSLARENPQILYRGVVVDNIDPERMGRVRVHITAITPNGAKKEIAKWAWTATLFGGGQENGEKYGSFMPWPIGSKVFVIFEESQGTYDNPVIIGGWYQGDREPIEKYDKTTLNDDIGPVPRCWGWKTPKGHLIMFREEDDDELIQILTQGGRSFAMSDKPDAEVLSMRGKYGNELMIKDVKGKGRILLQTEKGQGLVIDDESGSVQLNAKSSLVLGGNSVTVAAGIDLDLTGGVDVTVSGSSVSVTGFNTTAIGNKEALGTGLVSIDAKNLLVDAIAAEFNIDTTWLTNAGGIVMNSNLGTVFTSAMGIAIDTATTATINAGTVVNVVAPLTSISGSLSVIGPLISLVGPGAGATYSGSKVFLT